MRRNAARLAAVFLAAVMCGGCVTAAKHQEQLGSTAERAMTLGVVQKEIRIGMSQADVAAALGSPNIVTRDSANTETWVYDRMATEVTYSRDAGGVGILGLLIGAGRTLAGAGASGSYTREAGASSSTQRTLTVVLRFDAKGLVESMRYHASRF